MNGQSLWRRSARWLLAGAFLSLAVVATAAADELGPANPDAPQTHGPIFQADSIKLDAHRTGRVNLTTADLMPGDSVTDAVVVDNLGAAQLRYAMRTLSSNTDAKGLRDVLTLTITTIDATTPGDSCDTYDGRPVLASTTLGSGSAGFGSAAFGADPGDRTLPAGTRETLCLRVTMLLEAGTAYQGASTTTTFTFIAESTENNP